ncbi:MAG: hypothetical protein FWE34_07270 [Defluviitaleaceae bacterium]|nr:hypothetical protein [Defluviitaleaceae bacterium]
MTNEPLNVVLEVVANDGLRNWITSEVVAALAIASTVVIALINNSAKKRDLIRSQRHDFETKYYDKHHEEIVTLVSEYIAAFDPLDVRLKLYHCKGEIERVGIFTNTQYALNYISSKIKLKINSNNEYYAELLIYLVGATAKACLFMDGAHALHDEIVIQSYYEGFKSNTQEELSEEIKGIASEHSDIIRKLETATNQYIVYEKEKMLQTLENNQSGGK